MIYKELVQSHCLKRVPKAGQALDDLATRCSALIRSVKLEHQQPSDDDYQAVGQYGGVHAWPVAWLVLLAEHSRANNTTDTACTHKGRRGKSTLPLSTDVVSLEGEDARNVGVGRGGGKEDTKVADTDILREAEESKADDTHGGIDDDQWAAGVVLVAVPGTTVHPYGGADVGWSDEALGVADGKAHANLKDNWQKVGDGVGTAIVLVKICTRSADEKAAYEVVVKPNNQAKPQILESQACLR